mmetsp:Transcript_74468/g.125405  ORF Transcript_74468/g.125405 Transcript_74468/m.125405 type:complete len:98 (-) Transcript_74468:307-600(-)
MFCSALHCIVLYHLCILAVNMLRSAPPTFDCVSQLVACAAAPFTGQFFFLGSPVLNPGDMVQSTNIYANVVSIQCNDSLNTFVHQSAAYNLAPRIFS